MLLFIISWCMRQEDEEDRMPAPPLPLHISLKIKICHSTETDLLRPPSLCPCCTLLATIKSRRAYRRHPPPAKAFNLSALSQHPVFLLICSTSYELVNWGRETELNTFWIYTTCQTFRITWQKCFSWSFNWSFKFYFYITVRGSDRMKVGSGKDNEMGIEPGLPETRPRNMLAHLPYWLQLLKKIIVKMKSCIQIF